MTQTIAVCGGCLGLIVSIDGEWRHYQFVTDTYDIVPLPARDEHHGAVFTPPTDDLPEKIRRQVVG